MASVMLKRDLSWKRIPKYIISGRCSISSLIRGADVSSSNYRISKQTGLSRRTAETGHAF
jgi:hypothetical protein